MRIISFAWTTPQLLDGSKSVTRRRWKDCRLKSGELVQAWDKQPRFGGKRVATIRIIKVTRIPLNWIDAEDMKREGFEGQDPKGFVANWLEAYKDSHADEMIWRIEFEMLCDNCAEKVAEDNGRRLCAPCLDIAELVDRKEQGGEI